MPANRPDGVAARQNHPLLPEPLEPRRITGGVADRVLNVAMPEIILDEPGVGSLVGQSEAAAVPEHMRVSTQRQGSRGAVFIKQQIDCRTMSF